MLFIAHRGESEVAPENTIESFVLAWTRGVAGIEGDFHLTRDGVLVCMHDENALRTCGVNRRISDMSLEEVEKLDCGQWKGPGWAHTEGPTLTEVLETLPEDGFIFLELKTVDEQVIHALRRSFGEAEIADRQVCIISFYDSVLCRCKKEFPRIRCFYLTGFDPAVSPEALVAKVKAMDLDGIDCEASTELTDKYVKAMHKAGLEFHVWTVDEPEKAIYFMNLEVDSITTNRPYALWCEINEG